MALRWDPLLVRQLARELDDVLQGARLRALRLDGSTRDAALLFRETTLHWPLHPTRGAVQLLGPAEPAKGDLIVTGRVRHVVAPADERIVVMEILPTRRTRRALDIRVELMGNQWNLVVTEGSEARIRHILARRRTGGRMLAVGSAYVPPASEDREGCLEPIPVERWEGILAGVPAGARSRTLVRTVAWTSSVNAEALTSSAASVPGGEDFRDGYRLWRALAHGDTPPRPVLLRTPRGAQPYPWPLPGLPSAPQPTLLEAFAAWAAAEHEAESVLAPDLVAGLETAVDHALRRVSSLRAELDGAEDPAVLRASGDLLLARLSSVPSGAREVVLEDFEGRSVRIELEPRRAPHENADAFYQRAARAERALQRLPRLLAEAEARAHRLEKLLDDVHRGEASADEVRRGLPDEALVHPSHSPTSTPALPYRSYRSSGGLEIRVGRGARHNDDLTFHHAAPQDVWLHARDVAGAHVILRWGRAQRPPARDLQEAAVLAALGSKARTSGTVPVDWTFRKYVRKPRGASPGTVTMERARTLFVTPDPELAERLVEGEGS